MKRSGTKRAVKSSEPSCKKIKTEKMATSVVDRFTSTPEKNGSKLNPKDNVVVFTGDASLFESPEKMSPIKARPSTSETLYNSDTSYDNIKLFDDDNVENELSVDCGLSSKKLRHDYGSIKSCKKQLYTNDSTEIKKVKAVAKKTRKRKPLAQINEWTTNLNDHFKEVDSFELTIE